MKLAGLIKIMFQQNLWQSLYSELLSDTYCIQNDLKQGDVLLPSLLNVASEYLRTV
jgi:hypothetical protein